MKKTIILLSLVLVLLLGACKPKTNPDTAIAVAVAGTLAALPQPTVQPTYTPYPITTPDAPALQGLFCEYQFCIGHPQDIALFDVRKAENPSVYTEGMLASYRADLFTLVLWQQNHGSDDPQFMLDLIMGFGEVDSQRGNLEVNLLGDLTTFYAPLKIIDNKNLPEGGVAAWICGERAFSWMTYAPSEDIAKQLFQDAISKFRCE